MNCFLSKETYRHKILPEELILGFRNWAVIIGFDFPGGRSRL